MLTRKKRDKYWDLLAKRFPRVPVGWTITDGQSPGPEMRHGTSILSCAFSPDSALIAAAGGGCIPECDTSIRIWDAETGKEALICRGHNWGVFQLAFDPRSGILASASHDYGVFLWNLEKRDVIFLVGEVDAHTTKGNVAFAATRPLLVIGENRAFEDEVCSVYVIDLSSGEEVFRWETDKGDYVSSTEFSTDGAIVVCATQGFYDQRAARLVCWDVSQGELRWERRFPEATVSELHLLPGERKMVASMMLHGKEDYEAGVYLLDMATGKVEAWNVDKGICIHVAVSPADRFLARGHYGGRIELLRLPDLEPLRVLEDPPEDTASPICALRFFPDGRKLLVGDAQGVLRTLPL